MRRHLRILFALTLFIGAVGGCSPTSPSTLSVPPPPPPPPPPPTGVQLAGSVADAAWRPLGGARVEVVAGEGTGLSTVTDGAGQFRLTGPFDDTTQVRATANGHLDSTMPFPPFCAPCNPNRWLHFNLEADAPHADLAGNYQMTFVADSTCPTLPDEARERTFSATVARNPYSNTAGNSQFTMTVSGATVLAHLTQGGYMGIAGDFLSLGMGDGHGSMGVVEEVAANTYIALEGSSVGSVGLAVTEIVLPFNGTVEHCTLSGPIQGQYYACSPPSLVVKRSQCQSPNHRLVLRRLN